MSQLELKTQYSGETARLVCIGRIVAGTEAEELDTAIQELLLKVNSTDLDLEHVTFLDSSGIGVLVRRLVRARADHKNLRIIALSPQARKTLEMTNVLGQFPVADEARLQLRPGLRVLFVHPSADIRTFVASLLKSRGAAVQACASMYDARILNTAADHELLIVPAEIDPSGLAKTKNLRLRADFFECKAETAAEALIAQINDAMQ